MSKILKNNVILPSWNIIKDDSKIKKFYILPGLLSIIFLTVLLVYQSIYTYVVLFGKKDEALVVLLKFFHSDYAFEMIVVSVIFLIFYFLLLPIYEGGLIKYIHLKKSENPISTSEAFGQGLYKFFPVFEYNNIFSEFKIISILNAYLFTIRFIGLEYINTINYVFIIIFIFGIIINVLFAYSKYFIVIENKSVFESIGISSKMTILNLKRTLHLYFLMLSLNVRVVFNFLIFLSFPIIMVIAIGLITTKIFLVVAITILSILFIAFIVALGYLSAVLEVFKTSAWYYAYIESKNKLKELEIE